MTKVDGVCEQEAGIAAGQYQDRGYLGLASDLAPTPSQILRLRISITSGSAS